MCLDGGGCVSSDADLIGRIYAAGGYDVSCRHSGDTRQPVRSSALFIIPIEARPPLHGSASRNAGGAGTAAASWNCNDARRA